MQLEQVGIQLCKRARKACVQAIGPLKPVVVAPTYPKVHVRMNGVKTLRTEPMLHMLGLGLHLLQQSARRAKFARNDERSEGSLAHGAFLSGVG